MPWVFSFAAAQRPQPLLSCMHSCQSSSNLPNIKRKQGLENDVPPAHVGAGKNSDRYPTLQDQHISTHFFLWRYDKICWAAQALCLGIWQQLLHFLLLGQSHLWWTEVVDFWMEVRGYHGKNLVNIGSPIVHHPQIPQYQKSLQIITRQGQYLSICNYIGLIWFNYILH